MTKKLSDVSVVIDGKPVGIVPSSVKYALGRAAPPGFLETIECEVAAKWASNLIRHDDPMREIRLQFDALKRPRDLLVTVRLRAHNRDGPEVSWLDQQDVIPCDRITKLEVADTVRALIHRALIHEADEWIHVEDQRFFDPHDPARRA